MNLESIIASMGLDKSFKLFDLPYLIGIGAICLLLIHFIFRNRTLIIDSSGQQVLLRLCLGYMVASAGLFLLAMTLPWWLSAFTFLAFCMCVYALYDVSADSHDPYEIKVNHLLMICFVFLFSCLPIFMGHSCTWDWAKHRSIIIALFRHPFSPIFTPESISGEIFQEEIRVVYYFGMYLPGIALLKLLSLPFSQLSYAKVAYYGSLFTVAWCFIGATLSILLMPRACRRLVPLLNKPTWGVTLWIPFLFMDWKYWYSLFLPGQKWLRDVEGLVPYFAIYSDIVTTFVWAPQHQVTGMLAAVFLLAWSPGGKSRFPLALYSTFLLSSSPFCWLGTFPLFPFLKESLKISVKEIATAVILALPVLLYYMGRSHPETFQLNPDLLKDYGRHFLILPESIPYGVWCYLALLAFELGPFVIVGVPCFVMRLRIPLVVWASLASLIVIPLFYYGRWNDLSLRVSIPSLLTLLIFSTAVFQLGISLAPKLTRYILFALLLVNLPCFLNSLSRVMLHRSPTLINNLPELNQYSGTPDPFERFR